MNRIHLSLVLLSVSVVAGSLLLGCKGTTPDPVAAKASPVSGRAVYEHYCMGCHGAQGQGINGSAPALTKLGIRIPDDTIRRFIRNGRGKMPAFKEMSEADLNALIAYVKTF